MTVPKPKKYAPRQFGTNLPKMEKHTFQNRLRNIRIGKGNRNFERLLKDSSFFLSPGTFKSRFSVLDPRLWQSKTANTERMRDHATSRIRRSKTFTCFREDAADVQKIPRIKKSFFHTQEEKPRTAQWCFRATFLGLFSCVVSGGLVPVGRSLSSA